MDRHFIGHWALGMAFGVAAGAVACAPRSDSGGCAEDLDCARGDYCDTTARQCVAAELDTTATESPAEAAFTDKIVPFHRGEICLPMEVPFLSNADMAQIAANPEDHDTIEQLVHQYPEDDGRVPDGRSISILSSHPAPPTSCRDGACPCFPIGF